MHMDYTFIVLDITTSFASLKFSFAKKWHLKGCLFH